MRNRSSLLIIVLMMACASKQNSTKNSAQLDAYFHEQFPAQEPGGAILVMKDDSVLFSQGYGLADIKTNGIITSKTLFNLGSITKTFVANAILLLQEEGKLSVEDSLIQYFPNFKNKKIVGKIKIKHLLTHTSGLPDNRQVNKDTAFYLTAKDEENWYPETQVDNLLFEPGSQFDYSNPAFNGLALIIEKVSGMKWQTFIEQHIMKPSGMNMSTITDGPHPESGVAHAYVYNGGQWTEDDYGEEPTFAAAGNGGVWSSVEELAKYEKALEHATFLKEASILDSRTIKYFDTWRDTVPPDANWSWINPTTKNSNDILEPFIGWSWFIYKTKDGAEMVGHTGSQGGFLCNYVTIPEKKIFFVILCNTPRDVKGFSEKIMSWLKEEKYL
jgi:CubicO group peptidase (beta-lactamase class C family)